MLLLGGSRPPHRARTRCFIITRARTWRLHGERARHAQCMSPANMANDHQRGAIFWKQAKGIGNAMALRTYSAEGQRRIAYGSRHRRIGSKATSLRTRGCHKQVIPI